MFQQGMPTAYVDLKAAFDSVHREALWDLLCLGGISAEIIVLLSGLYSGTECAVKWPCNTNTGTNITYTECQVPCELSQLMLTMKTF